MNSQKTPLARTINALVQSRIAEAIAKLPLALPGEVVSVSGAIITVSFDVQGVTLPQIAMPLAYPEYIRLPIQVGDKGMAIAASTSLKYASGIAVDKPDLKAQPFNLETLAWVPLGSKNFSAVDPQAVTIYGPNGVVMRDSNSETTWTLTPSGVVLTAQNSITFQVGSHAIVINSSGITIDGVQFLTHEHLPGTYVAPSGGGPITGDSGAVT